MPDWTTELDKAVAGAGNGELRRETLCDAMVIPRATIRSFEILTPGTALDRERIS